MVCFDFITAIQAKRNSSIKSYEFACFSKKIWSTFTGKEENKRIASEFYTALL